MAVARATLRPRDLRSQLGLSRERLGRILSISSKTVERWEGLEQVPRSERAARRLAALDEAVRLGRLSYEPDALRRLLATPLREFDGLTALQLIEQDQGDRVLALLAADYEGSVS